MRLNVDRYTCHPTSSKGERREGAERKGTIKQIDPDRIGSLPEAHIHPFNQAKSYTIQGSFIFFEAHKLYAGQETSICPPWKIRHSYGCVTLPRRG